MKFLFCAIGRAEFYSRVVTILFTFCTTLFLLILHFENDNSTFSTWAFLTVFVIEEKTTKTIINYDNQNQKVVTMTLDCRLEAVKWQPYPSIARVSDRTEPLFEMPKGKSNLFPPFSLFPSLINRKLFFPLQPTCKQLCSLRLYRVQQLLSPDQQTGD